MATGFGSPDTSRLSVTGDLFGAAACPGINHAGQPGRGRQEASLVEAGVGQIAGRSEIGHSMLVPVVDVRVVGVGVSHGRVAVRVGVRLARRVVRAVFVFVVVVVDVGVFVE